MSSNCPHFIERGNAFDSSYEFPNPNSQQLTSFGKRILSSCLMLILLVLIGIGLNYARAKTVDPRTGAETTLPQASSTLPLFTPRVRLWIQRDDVRPKVIRIWPGTVFLVIENPTGINGTLVMERVVAGTTTLPTARLPISAGIIRSKKEFTLALGDYVFYEQSHPEIKGKLVVQPR